MSVFASELSTLSSHITSSKCSQGLAGKAQICLHSTKSHLTVIHCCVAVFFKKNHICRNIPFSYHWEWVRGSGSQKCSYDKCSCSSLSRPYPDHYTWSRQCDWQLVGPVKMTEQLMVKLWPLKSCTSCSWLSEQTSIEKTAILGRSRISVGRDEVKPVYVFVLKSYLRGDQNSA